MAFILPNFSPTATIAVQSKDKIILHLHHLSSSPKPPSPPNITPILTNSRHETSACASASASASATSAGEVSQVSKPPDKHPSNDDFYVNLGLAVRTLREDLPLLFTKHLNYDIYRDDITFVDPLNTFTGIDNYKLIFWALRFHGRILFHDISLEVLRIWQPSDRVILIRWNLRGTPRVPWEAKGQFQGTSWYKLDRNGKIYEHKVDNLAFNFPQSLKPAASVLDLVAACPASPNPTFLWGPADVHSSSWVEFYRAVRDTLDHGGCGLHIPQDCFLSCS